MVLRDKTFVLCMKGLEIGTGERLSQVAREYLDSSNAIAVWLGPGHVQEFYRGVPNCMVIDSENADVKQRLVREFSSDLIRFYYGHGYFIHSTENTRGYIRALLVHELEMPGNYDLAPVMSR